MIWILEFYRYIRQLFGTAESFSIIKPSEQKKRMYTQSALGNKHM